MDTVARDSPGSGEDVGAGEVGADVRFVEVPGDGAVSFDAHDEVEVDEPVADLAGAGHLAGQVVRGDGVLERVAPGHRGDGEGVGGPGQGDDRRVVDELNRQAAEAGITVQLYENWAYIRVISRPRKVRHQPAETPAQVT
ncbi:hypothetical protein [Streptomyces sp. NPDC055992]|uniref:hypothetical protein n=1 Tax=Streptomyces sp. NPDC055992 TaxID=3345673 RepID=UPI0035D9EE51